jgi:hypothetical protein
LETSHSAVPFFPSTASSASLLASQDAKNEHSEGMVVEGGKRRECGFMLDIDSRMDKNV